MKTLKQHLQKIFESKPLNSRAIPWYYEDEVIKAVKEWLQEQPRYYRESPIHEYTQEPMLRFNKLIEELEQ